MDEKTKEEIFRDSIYQEISLSIDSLFQTSLSQDEYAGVGVSIVLDSNIVVSKGYGYRDMKKKIKVNEHTIFRIGSVSKSITAVLCAILEKKGSIDYHTRIHNSIPSFNLVDSSFNQNLQLRHLLSHTAGFPYHSYTNLVEDGLKMKKIIPYFEKISNLQEPGTQYSYQNAAYGAVGTLLENETQSSIQSLFEEDLFCALGMNRTSSTYQKISLNLNKTKPHIRSQNTWEPSKLNKKYYNAVTAGGINSTANDMALLLHLLLGNRPDILDRNAIKKMIEPKIRTKVGYRYYKKWDNFHDSYYAYGWRVHTFKDEASNRIDTLYHHGGLVNKYRSEIAFHPEEKFGISVLFNCMSDQARTIIPEIIKVIRRHKKSPQKESL